MARPPIISGVDCNATSWANNWKKLPLEIQREARKLIGEMLMCEQMPAKLHFHKLHGFDNIYTIHICSRDTYKASFKIVDRVAVFRKCGEHDEIDGNP